MHKVKTRQKVGQLYHYIVEDELGNQEEVMSVQEYPKDTQVRIIWSKMSDEYDTPYIVKVS